MILQNDDDRLNHDWRKEMTVADRYKKHKLEILKMLEAYKAVLNGQLGQIKTKKHRNELASDGFQPEHSVLYKAGPTAGHFAANEIGRMLRKEIAQRDTTEWSSPIIFAPGKDSSLRPCEDYRKLNNVIVRNSYPHPCMDKCICSLGEARIFST